MDIKRYGKASPFRHVIIPETADEVRVMLEANELAETRDARERRAAKGLQKTLEYALAVEQGIEGASYTPSFTGVVVPTGAQSSRLGNALYAVTSQIYIEGVEGRQITSNDELVVAMSSRIAESFAM